jgi:hypothetical protein
MFAEFLGTPQTGPQGVITVVTDRSGNLVWLDHQTADDSVYSRIKPHGPMEMAFAVVEKLRLALELAEPGANGGYQGKWAEYYRNVEEDYGAPTKDERLQIEKRTSKFFATGRTGVIMIYDACIPGNPPQSSRELVEALADMLEQQGFTDVNIMDSPERLPFQPSSNQAKMFWQRFRNLSSKMTAVKPDADYILMVDVFGSPGLEVIGGIHIYVVDRQGELVHGRLWNSHHDLFTKYQPDSVADVTGMIAEHLSTE